MTIPLSRHARTTSGPFGSSFNLARTTRGSSRTFREILVRLLLGALIAALPFAAPAQAQSGTGQAGAAPVARTGAHRVDAVEAELVADVARAVPGEPFRIGLRLKHDPHWHTYWRNPGDSGLPTRFEPTGPAGATYDAIVWPAPRRLAIGDLANYGYENDVLLSRRVSLPPSLSESTVRFEVNAQWLVCKDVCIPGEAALALELPLGTRAQPAAADILALFDDSTKRAPQPGARMQAGWWQQGEQAYVVLPAGIEASRAEFFPYFESVVRPAAAQSLLAATGANSETSRGVSSRVLKLEVVPASGVHGPGQSPARASPETALPEPAAGLLLADGKPIEVGLQLVADAPAPGKLISVAEVVPAAPPSVPGLLDRLRGRAFGVSVSSSSSPPGSAAAASAASSTAATAGAAITSGARVFPSPASGMASGTLPLAILGAIIGGLILNLMPCVFPVIGLKVLSFAQSAGGDARAARAHALVFSAGVVLSFLALGVALLALRSAGEAAGWGFQMQSPLFVGAMALLFVLIGLNLFGVFETGVSLTRLDVPGSRLDGGLDGGTKNVGAAGAGSAGSAGSRGLLKSFWTGVIAVLVATPCTAPFMGSAVGFTISSPPIPTLLVFTALGTGMALPYLLLGLVPRLLRWLPRPGPWLLVFKQLLAFPMLATAAWLAWILTLQAGADGLLRLLMSAILVAFAAWVYGRAQSARFSGASGPGLAGVAAAIVACALTAWQLAQFGARAPGAFVGGVAVDTPAEAGRLASTGVVSAAGSGVPPASKSAEWQPWSTERVSQALAQGRPVLVDFTAAWCISCQANKKLVLEREVIRRAFDANGVVLLRADWTSRNPAITAELARFGRNGVPLYLVYGSANEPPLMLPELLTVDIVLAALGTSR